MLCSICKPEDKESVIRSIFSNTTTIGIREASFNRYVLDRKFETLQTPYGEVRKKTSFGYGAKQVKYEYDDLARIAEEQNLSLTEVKRLLK